MPNKYPGGYQIIDLKGVVIKENDTVTIADKEIANKLSIAMDIGKPVYITDFVDDDGLGIPNPALIIYDDNNSNFHHVHMGEITGTWSWSLIIDTTSIDDGEVAISIEEP